MANLSATERSQIERWDLADRRSRLNGASRDQERVFAALSVIFIAVLGVMTYAAVQVFDGWHHLIVIADMAILLLGIAAWVNPRRRHV